MVTEEKLTTLLAWFDENKYEWRKDLIQVRISNGAFAVYAVKDITEKQPLVKIPKSSVLSSRSCGIANILDDEAVDGGCSLAVAVMYELAQGKESPWYGYLQALPASEDLPIFWEVSELELLRGTEMYNAVLNDMNDLKDDYDNIVVPLLKKYPYIFKNVEQQYTFDLFRRITSLISSRSFEVDAYHGTALVPFADLFNHRSRDEHVHFENDFDVCEACGELEYCEHQYLHYLENGSDDDEEHGDEWSDMDTEEDIEEEEENGQEMADDDADGEKEGPLEDLEELEKARVDFWKDDQEDEDKKDTCDMVLDRPVKAGEEVFNTYGKHPNIVLLSKYGFCHDDNENDYISVDMNDVFETCVDTVKEELRRTQGIKDDDALTENAVEYVRSRFEYFVNNKDILCDIEEDDEHMEHGCCDGEEDYAHSHGESDEVDEEETGLPARPFFANVEGHYEDSLICLLHITFVDNRLFNKFKKDVNEALKYFAGLAADSQSRNNKKLPKNTELLRTWKTVYAVCQRLSESRSQLYMNDNGQWTPVEEDVKARNQTTNKRIYYALTCRISEKRIIQQSISYYKTKFQELELPDKDVKIRKDVAAKKKKKLRR